MNAGRWYVVADATQKMGYVGGGQVWRIYGPKSKNNKLQSGIIWNNKAFWSSTSKYNSTHQK